MKTFLPLLIILAVLGVAVGSVWYLTRPPEASPAPAAPAAGQSPQARPANSQATPVRAAASQGVPGAEPPHTHGPASAPVHIEEFGDFQCPPCGLLHPILEQMEAEFGDQLRVTYRHFPLPNHRHALIAASASEAAGLQGKFWQMHKLIYDNQVKWKDEFDARPIFEGYAKQIGLDIERYNRDIEGNVVAQRIFQDGKRAHSLGVKGTPTVFMNGREVPFQSLPAEKLRVIIQKELASIK